MLKTLGRMAAALDARWKSAGYRISAFPALAAEELASSQAHLAYDSGALAQWILGAKSFPPAINPFGNLGPPAFTVWSNGRFVVNVYAYNTPEVVIHDHNFAGAFVNAAGHTLHCTFRFDPAERINGSVRVGTLSAAEAERISPGDIRRIDAGSRFIHQVWHLSTPTVVLVVRTPGLPRRTLRQFEYLRPAIAAEILRDDENGTPARRFRYTRKMLESLRTTGTAVRYLTSVIEQEHAWAAVWHLMDNWPFLRSAGAVGDVIARGVKRHGSWFGTLETVGARLALYYLIDWRRVATERDRLVMALLMTQDSWRPISERLQSLVPDASPQEAVIESLSRLGEQRAIPLALTNGQRAILECTLGAEGDARRWKSLVGESFEIGGRSEWRRAREVERDLRTVELLRPLLTFD